jgi:hypothetical protein
MARMEKTSKENKAKERGREGAETSIIWHLLSFCFTRKWETVKIHRFSSPPNYLLKPKRELINGKGTGQNGTAKPWLLPLLKNHDMVK